MISRIHQKLGTAGFVLAIIALVAATTGGAFALTSSDKKLIKKEAKKWSKKYSKRFAKAGPAGPAGKDGINGTNGTNGTPGTPGAPGEDGKDGADGASVIKINEAPTGCDEGGVTYEVVGSGEEDEICNGEEGSPWTAGGTLPPGETETGAWGFITGEPAIAESVSASFNIPLAAAPASIHVIKANGLEKTGLTEQAQPKCPGTAAAPAADPGVFCLYVSEETEPLVNPKFGALTKGFATGVVVVMVPAENARYNGTWAVTAAP